MSLTIRNSIAIQTSVIVSFLRFPIFPLSNCYLSFSVQAICRSHLSVCVSIKPATSKRLFVTLNINKALFSSSSFAEGFHLMWMGKGSWIRAWVISTSYTEADAPIRWLVFRATTIIGVQIRECLRLSGKGVEGLLFPSFGAFL